MARSVTLQTIVDRARIHADMTNSGFASDARCLLLLNDIYPKLYDELVSADENYYADSEDVAISSADDSYDLPDDFYKLLSVRFNSGGQYYPLMPFPEAERDAVFGSSSLPSGTVRIRYIPAPTVFTALSQSVDGIAGWDRMLSLLLAIDLMDAEESNTDRLFRKYQEEIARIRTTSDRDVGMPARITDVYTARVNYDWLRYRLYGDSIEFVSTEYMGV